MKDNICDSQFQKALVGMVFFKPFFFFFYKIHFFGDGSQVLLAMLYIQ